MLDIYEKIKGETFIESLLKTISEMEKTNLRTCQRWFNSFSVKPTTEDLTVFVGNSQIRYNQNSISFKVSIQDLIEGRLNQQIESAIKSRGYVFRVKSLNGNWFEMGLGRTKGEDFLKKINKYIEGCKMIEFKFIRKKGHNNKLDVLSIKNNTVLLNNQPKSSYKLYRRKKKSSLGIKYKGVL